MQGRMFARKNCRPHCESTRLKFAILIPLAQTFSTPSIVALFSPLSFFGDNRESGEKTTKFKTVAEKTSRSPLAMCADDMFTLLFNDCAGQTSFRRSQKRRRLFHQVEIVD